MRVRFNIYMNSSRVPSTPKSHKGFAAYIAILAVVAVFVSIYSILQLKNPPAPADLYQAAIVSTTAAPAAPAAPASIAFVQSIGNNAGYGPTSKTLALTFPAANTVGNLIILSVNWGNTAIQVASITDTRGNTYANITGQVNYGKGYPQSNQLYYAKNIPAGANTITVTMSGKPSVVFEARAYEYAGLDTVSPLDQFSSATGTNASQVNPVAGTGFTGHDVTNAGNSLGEDMLVSTAGSYSTTELIGVKTINSGSKNTTVASELIFGLGNYNYKQATPDWFMSMATFKAATINPTPTPTPMPIPSPVIPPPPPTPTPVPTPTPTPNPTPTPTPNPTITIGETNILPSDDNGNGNLLLAQNATLIQTATIRSLSFYVTVAGGNLHLGIYDATGPGGGPGAKKAETASFTPVVGWNTANVITPVSLTAGTYWLAYLPSSNTLAFKKDTTAGVSGKYYTYTYGVMPATFSTAPASTASHWSLYATLN
jgi:hypothetical protein